MPTPILIYLIAVVVLVGAAWIWAGRFNKRHRLDKEFQEVFGVSSPARDGFLLYQTQGRVSVAIQEAGMELAAARANVKRYDLAIHSRVAGEKEAQYRRLRRLARNAGYKRAFLSDIDLKVRHGFRNKEEAREAHFARAA